MSVKPVPDSYNTVTPYLVVYDAAALIDFILQAFNAEVIERMPGPDGSVMHAEVRIGDSVVMLGEASEDNPPMPAMLYLYLEDCDAAYRKALAAGATSIREPRDEFYGDRSAGVKDAFGDQWWFATHIEDVPPDELQRRMEALPQQA